MDQKDLYAAIEQITQELRYFHYPLNDERAMDHRILRHNKTTRQWETYTVNERGGCHNLLSFNTEEEACVYVLEDVIKSVKFRFFMIDAVKCKYMGKDNSECKQMSLLDLFRAIQQLKDYQYNDYLNDRSIEELCGANRKYEDKKWQYTVVQKNDGKNEFVNLDSKKEACESVFDDAVNTIETFKNLWMDAQKDKS